MSTDLLIYVSSNGTFVCVMDLLGQEMVVCVMGGKKVRSDCDESLPHAAMLAAQDVAVPHIKLCIADGNNDRSTWSWCVESSPYVGAYWCPEWPCWRFMVGVDGSILQCFSGA